jgi:thiamine transport system substrate-binding protein
MKPLIRLGLALMMVAACTSDGGAVTTASAKPVTLTLVTHDSFVVSDGVLETFTADTGIKVKVLASGDAGEAVNQAILTKDDPQGDVLYGVDNTYLSRALDADLFVPHMAKGVDAVPAEFMLDDKHRVTPIDYGDVCLNIDKSYFAAKSLAPPASLDDLVAPAYKGLTVVENPATSSPGLAFLIGTIEQYGDAGWQDWWTRLRDNDVLVANSWDDAYHGKFSGGGESTGDRPIVVSYASSPPAEVVFADPPITQAPTAVVDASCVRQIELAGILRGTKHEKEAGQLLDFMLSKRFQEDLPLQMFVFPVLPAATLPEAFVKYAARPAHPLQVDARAVADHRDEWLQTWTGIVLR